MATVERRGDSETGGSRRAGGVVSAAGLGPVGEPRPRTETWEPAHNRRLTASIIEFAALRRGFTNWPSLVCAIVLGRLRGQPPGLHLRARGGFIAWTPTGDRSWWTIVETMGADTYRLASMELPETPTVLDIGANLGGFTLALLRHRPRARVAAYEPSPFAFAACRENLSQNGLTEQVTLSPSAVTGRSAERLTLYQDRGDTCTSTLLPGNHDATPVQPVEVAAVTLTEAVLACDADIDLLKLDVEGAEYDIILGTPPDVLRRVHRIVLEYHPVPGSTVAQLASHLAAAGFSWERQEHAALVDQGLGWWRRARATP